MISISRVVRFKELMHSIYPGLGLGEVSLSHSPPSSWASAWQWRSPGFMIPCHNLWKWTYWRINTNFKALLEFALPEKNLHLHSSSPCLCPKSSVQIARVLSYILGIFVEDHERPQTHHSMKGVWNKYITTRQMFTCYTLSITLPYSIFLHQWKGTFRLLGTFSSSHTHMTHMSFHKSAPTKIWKHWQ